MKDTPSALRINCLLKSDRTDCDNCQPCKYGFKILDCNLTQKIRSMRVYMSKKNTVMVIDTCKCIYMCICVDETM